MYQICQLQRIEGSSFGLATTSPQSECHEKISLHQLLKFCSLQNIVSCTQTSVFKVRYWEQHFSCLATLLHCKLKPFVARITTFMTDLSGSKIQCYKSANSTRFIGQSCVNKDEARFHIIWRFGERPLGPPGSHSLYFPCQRR